jgi:hypothetical protein
MSAAILDTEVQDEQTNEPVQQSDAVDAPKADAEQPAPQATPAPKPEDTTPAKYKGKSVEELIAMHAEAEKLIGRQGLELGTLRQTHDEFIKASLAERSKIAAPKTEEAQTSNVDDDVEFFADPKKAIKKVLESDPELQQMREERVKAQREKATAELAQKHPDGRDILNDPQFQQWVTSSSIRLDLLKRADQTYDVAAANELFDTWKALRGVAAKSATTAAPDTTGAHQEALKAATVPSGSTAPASGDGKKFYNRTDLLKLMRTDPARYEAMGDEILLAYREGRVRNR